MSVCANCGAENPLGQRFCGSCGNALAAVCASCGGTNPAGQRFCGECGAPLTVAAPAPVPVAEAPVSERRLVSLLFADLVGFTTLSESRDPEAVRELLSRYFDTCRRLVELYGDGRLGHARGYRGRRGARGPGGARPRCGGERARGRGRGAGAAGAREC